MNSPRLSAEARREQILDVAINVFGRAGYFGASMNDIADAAGVTKPVLYQHFDSKRDLYQALIEEVGNRLRTNIDKATAEATNGKSQTELGFRAYFRWVADDHDGFRLLFGSGSRRDDEFNEAIRKITAESARAVAPLIAVDIDESHRETLAHALVGLAEGASRRLVGLGQDFDPDAIAAHIRQRLSADAFRINLADVGLEYTVAAHPSGRAVGYLLVAAGQSPLADRGLLEVRQIYVRAELHGSGLADELLAAAELRARTLGLDGLWLGTSKANGRAIAFYRRNGFRVHGERVFLVDDVPNQDWVLVRILGPDGPGPRH